MIEITPLQGPTWSNFNTGRELHAGERLWKCRSRWSDAISSPGSRRSDIEKVLMEKQRMSLTLSDLEPGVAVEIEKMELPESEQQFLLPFGFFIGAEVRCLRRAPLGDPIVYSLEGSEIALRAETACQIFVSCVDPKASGEIA
jgi:ferrous iron transport protein A